MDAEVLKTKEEYEKALKRFEEVFQAKRGTIESEEADVLALVLKEYEDKNYVINSPDK